MGKTWTLKEMEKDLLTMAIGEERIYTLEEIPPRENWELIVARVSTTLGQEAIPRGISLNRSDLMVRAMCSKNPEIHYPKNVG